MKKSWFSKKSEVEKKSQVWKKFQIQENVKSSSKRAAFQKYVYLNQCLFFAIQTEEINKNPRFRKIQKAAEPRKKFEPREKIEILDSAPRENSTEENIKYMDLVDNKLET